MRLVADSHAIAWYLQGSSRLSGTAGHALSEAESTHGIVVSVATLIDLWYVTQTTQAVTTTDLTRLRDRLASSPGVALQPIDVLVANETIAIPREVLSDPWDRFIVATARVMAIPLVTRDEAIQTAGLVTTVW